MNDIERRVMDVELRVVGDEGKKKIVGYAAVFDSWSEEMYGFREKIAPGAFRKTIRKADVRALFNHDPNYVLGRTTNKTLKLKEDNTGLLMEVDPPDTQFARDLMLQIDRGDITQQSFGFRTIKDEWNEDPKKNTTERTLVEVELFDVSPVTYPAYPDTQVALRSLEEYRNNNPDPDAQGSEGNDADELQGHESAFRGRDLELTKLDMEDSING